MLVLTGAPEPTPGPVASARFSADGRRLVFSQEGRVTVRHVGPEAEDHARLVDPDVTPLAAFASHDDVLVAAGRELRAWRLVDFVAR